VGQAKGWQVRRFVDPLMGTKPAPGGGETSEAAPVQRAPVRSPGEEEWRGPTAPPIYPNLTAGEEGGSQGVAPRHRSLLEEAVRASWPYNPACGQLANPLLGTAQLPQVIRVYRDLTKPGYTTGMEKLGDEEREAAHEKGWEGPWELTTWGKLIGEVLKDPEAVLEYLPEVPREEGARTTSLHYTGTSLDAWGEPGARAKSKSADFIVTPEGWHYGGMLQAPGMKATRAATPIRPDQSVKVRIIVQMVIVPYKGVYSVGADIEVLDDTPLTPERQELEPSKEKEPKPWGGFVVKIEKQGYWDSEVKFEAPYQNMSCLTIIPKWGQFWGSYNLTCKNPEAQTHNAKSGNGTQHPETVPNAYHEDWLNETLPWIWKAKLTHFKGAFQAGYTRSSRGLQGPLEAEMYVQKLPKPDALMNVTSGDFRKIDECVVTEIVKDLNGTDYVNTGNSPRCPLWQEWQKVKRNCDLVRSSGLCHESGDSPLTGPGLKRGSQSS
ncbi:uncharacterized protein AKAME5_002211700, partial [Lates japonicus]